MEKEDSEGEGGRGGDAPPPPHPSQRSEDPCSRGDEMGVAEDVKVDKTKCSVGEVIQVTWEMGKRPLHERDFIGMFEVREEQESHVTGGGSHGTDDEGHVTSLLDSRIRGDTSASRGHIQWTLTENLFAGRK